MLAAERYIKTQNKMLQINTNKHMVNIV